MFLTLEDPRARVKGSRDPLGVQPIWSTFGRHIIANLTTVTDSLRGFTVLLLGRYFGERLLRDGEIEEEEEVVDVFLRVEQVCGYARCLALEDNGRWAGRILGIERVKRRFSEGVDSVSIGVTPDAAILSDQKTYGLWGLFSVSARASKLLSDGPVGVSPGASGFVERHYLPQLAPVLGPLERLVGSGGTLDLKPPSSILRALKGILGELSAAERQFYRSYLCDGERCQRLPTGRQATFRRLLESHSEPYRGINRDELVAIKNAAQPLDSELARRIDRILVLEALLAPCDVIFRFLQTRHGQPPSEVAATFAERWGGRVPHLNPEEFDEIREEIAGVVGEDIAARMTTVHGALSVGAYRVAIEHLLAWNQLVMMHRSASPWVRLDDRGALDVRYRGVESEIPTSEAMSSLWRNSYFVNTLKALVHQTAETRIDQAP